MPDHPAGAADHCRLPHRRDGHRGPGAPAGRPRIGRHPRRCARPDRAVAAGAGGAVGAALRLSRRRAARRSAAPRPSWAAAGCRPRAPPSLASSTPKPSSACASEAWPEPANADELHDALVWLGFLTPRSEAASAPDGTGWLDELAASEARAHCCSGPGTAVWIAAERLPQFQALWPAAVLDPAIAAPSAHARRSGRRRRRWSRSCAGRLEGLGPVTRDAPRGARSASTPATSRQRWPLWRSRASPCAAASRRVATRRMVRASPAGARSIATPSSACAPRSSRLRHATSCASCCVAARGRGRPHGRPRRRRCHCRASSKASRAPAGAWESEILPARIADYEPAWLDDRCSSRPRRLGAAAAAQWPPRRRRAPAGAGAHHADHLAGASACSALGRSLVASAAAAYPASGRAQMVADCHPRSRRLVLRRDRGRHPAAAHRGRGRSGRAGRARARAPRTASAACAHCWSPPIAPQADAAAAGGAAPPFGMEAPAAGRWRGGAAAAEPQRKE